MFIPGNGRVIFNILAKIALESDELVINFLTWIFDCFPEKNTERL